MTIVSESNKTYKEFLKLKLKKYRKESGLFLAEGNHLADYTFAPFFCDIIILGK